MGRWGGGRLGAVRRLIRERTWPVLAALVLLHLVTAGLAFDSVPHGGGDNTAYLALARSILDHGRYLELWDPARPPHTQYPPGFPLILAVAWTLGLRSWAALKLMMVGFSAAAVGVSYLWMRARAGAAMALGLGVVLAVAPGLAGETGWVLSDIPFWAATMGALLALQRGRERWGIALAFAALALRTAGLPLILAIIGWLALRRRWKPAAATLAILVAVATLWTLRTVGLEASYVSQFWLENPYAPEAGRIGVVSFFERVLENADRYTFEILMRTVAGGVGIVGAIGGSLLIASAAIGFARSVSSSTSTSNSTSNPVVALFAVLYAGMLLVWPETWASERFLIPLLPVLLVYAAEGVAVLPQAGVRRAVRGVAVVAILGLGVPSSLTLWSDAADCRAAVRERGFLACLRPDQQAFISLAQWSRGRLPDDAVVISRKPRQWYWFSGYPGQVYPFTLDRTRLLEEARDTGAWYVVLDDLDLTATVYLTPAVRANQRWFCAIRQITRNGGSATLLGVLPVQWDAGLMGEETGDEEAVRLPRCQSGFEAGGGSDGQPGRGTGGGIGDADGG